VSVTLNAPPTRNQRLLGWVNEMVALCEPDSVHWFEGTDEEYELLSKQLVEAGTLVELDPAKRPGSYWAASDPGDVARVEDRTFVCSEREADAMIEKVRQRYRDLAFGWMTGPSTRPGNLPSRLEAAGLPKLCDLMSQFVANSGKVWLCGACTKPRGITEEQLAQGVTIVGAAKVVEEVVGGAKTVAFA